MTIFSAIQITSTTDYEKNISKSFDLIKKAKNYGAKIVSLPEVFTYLGNIDKDNFKYSFDLKSDFILEFSKLAKSLDIYILAGSFHEYIENKNKSYNTSILFSDNGTILNIYRKIHLFDTDILGKESYKESDNFESGEISQTNIVKTPYGNFGFSICYDLRFPEFYRKLTFNGAQIIFVPSAFTMHTGKDHWEVLLRARAIENQVYIVAPNQFGFHSEKKESYGNSMIIDPWGKVIARASDREEVIFADIDLSYIEQIRKKIPCLLNKKFDV